MNKVNLCWVISDGRKGHEIQSMAVAGKSAKHVQLFTFKSRFFQKLFAPHSLTHQLQSTRWNNITPNLSTRPDLIISCGRQAAAAAQLLKKKTGSKHIQILNPKGQLSTYDLLLLPHHDEVYAPNICHFTGSIHNTHQLKKSATHPILSCNTAVILGNPNKSYWVNQWDDDWEKINALNHDIFICGSPRLSNHAKHLIRTKCQKKHIKFWFDDSDGTNPYADLLSHAKRLYVTADSINMVNECLSTNKNVHLLATDYINSRRHLSFLKTVQSYISLKEKEKTTPWPNPLEEIIQCKKFQNLLNSPSSFNKG